MNFRFALASSVLLFAGFAFSAKAQDARAVDLERFVPALDSESYLTLQATAPPAHLRWNTQLSLGYAYRPFTVRDASGNVLTVVEDRTTATLAFQIGLGGRGALAVAAPFVLWQGRGDVDSTSGPAARGGIGDVRLVARYKLFGEVATDAIERPEGPGLAVQLTGVLPVGNRDLFAGERVARLGLQMLGEFRLFGFALGGMLGYRHRFAEASTFDAVFAGEIEGAFAVKAPLPWVRDLTALLEIRTVTAAHHPFQRATTAGEVALGARYRIGDFMLTGAFAVGITQGVGVPLIHPTLDLNWAPRKHDQDGDGIGDSDDLCPPLPEDQDGFQDEDGCPDPDNDEDMVPDADDRCPTETAEEGRDEDEDGCTDAAP